MTAVGHFETKSVDWSGSIVGPVLLHELTFCALRLGGLGSQLPLGTDGGRTGAAPAEVLPRSFFRYPSSCRSASWSRANWRGPFVDQLRDDRLALGDLSALSVRRDVSRLGDPKRRQVLLGPTAWVAGLALLDAGVKRPLAIAGRAFALRLGHVSSCAPWAPMPCMAIGARLGSRRCGIPIRDPARPGVTADLDQCLPRRRLAPISGLPLIVNMTMMVSATSTFETDESTPGSFPLLAP